MEQRWTAIRACVGTSGTDVGDAAADAAEKLVREYSVAPLTLEQLADELAYLITQVEAAGHEAEAVNRQRRAQAARSGCRFLASIAHHLPVKTDSLTNAVAWITPESIGNNSTYNSTH